MLRCAHCAALHVQWGRVISPEKPNIPFKNYFSSCLSKGFEIHFINHFIKYSVKQLVKSNQKARKHQGQGWVRVGLELGLQCPGWLGLGLQGPDWLGIIEEFNCCVHSINKGRQHQTMRQSTYPTCYVNIITIFIQWM